MGAIDFNNNIKVNAGKHIDSRYMNDRVPYTGTSQVNSIITTPERYIGLTVNISNTEYWYENGINNGNLVLKTTGGGGGGTALSASTVTVNVTTATTVGISSTLKNGTYIASGTTTYNLPAAPDNGTQYTIADGSGNALSANITINGNGNNIQNQTSATINTDYGSITVQYNGYFWSVVSIVS